MITIEYILFLPALAATLFDICACAFIVWILCLWLLNTAGKIIGNGRSE